MVEYELESLSDDLAGVAMTSFKRVQDGWNVSKLEVVTQGDAPATWHAKTGWARSI